MLGLKLAVMPREYKRKTNRASYIEDDLKSAIDQVKAGAPLQTTAKRYGISARTLRRHRDGKVSCPGKVKLGRFNPTINEEYEAALASKMSMFGLTTKDVRRLAYDFTTQMNVKHRFNVESKMAGPDWLDAAADTWMVANRGRKISFNDIAEIFCVAYDKVATVEKSVNGFRVCGLWPFNDHIFSDEDFVEVTTDEHSTSLPQEVQGLAFQEDQQSVGLPTTQQSVSLQVTPQVTEPQTTQQSVGSQTTQKIVSPQPNQQIVESQGIPHIFTPSTQQSVQSQRNQTDRETLDNEHVDELILDHDTPSTSANAMAQDILTAKRVLFELCTPKPNQARSNAKPQRKRKTNPEKSQLLTSSPFKAILMGKRKGNKNQKKTAPAPKRKAAGKRSKRINVYESDSDEETWPCLVCGEPYSNSKPGEKWIQCTICKLWAHEACTLGEFLYICQNCTSEDDDELF